VPERLGVGGVLQAAVDVPQCAGGFVLIGSGSPGGFFQLDAEHAASGGPVQSINDSAAGFVEQRYCRASSGRLEQHSAEVTVS
jgi:hypothetical protein